MIVFIICLLANLFVLLKLFYILILILIFLLFKKYNYITRLFCLVDVFFYRVRRRVEIEAIRNWEKKKKEK